MHRVQPRGRDYLRCYLLFAVLLALCYVAFVVWQGAISILVGVLLQRSEGSQAALGVGAVFLGLALFGFVMAAEPYLRGGVERGQLRARFFRLMLPLIGAIVFGEALRQLLYLYLQIFCKSWGTC